MIDAHCHIQFPAYDSDRDAVIARARGIGVKVIAVGTQLQTSRDAVSLAKEYPGEVWATAGFHPGHVAADWYFDRKEQRTAEQEQFDPKAFRALAHAPEVVAIGECGLDYYRSKTEEVRSKQEEVFHEQAEIAREMKKPLMLHCRPSKGTDDAYGDLLVLLKSYVLLPRILHFYVGSPVVTRTLLNAGFYFTFGGVITFSRDYDDGIRLIPLDRILLETDAPYAAPEPYRGKRNEPGYVVHVAEQLAQLKGTDAAHVVARTTETAHTLFKLI